MGSSGNGSALKKRSKFITPECNCGTFVVLFMSSTLENPNRLFHGCPYFKTPAPHCKFFAWLDEYVARCGQELRKPLFQGDEKQFERQQSGSPEFDLKVCNLEDRVVGLEKQLRDNKHVNIIAFMVVAFVFGIASPLLASSSSTSHPQLKNHLHIRTKFQVRNIEVMPQKLLILLGDTPTWTTSDAFHTVPSKLRQRHRQRLLRCTVSTPLSSDVTTFFQKLRFDGGIERKYGSVLGFSSSTRKRGRALRERKPLLSNAAFWQINVPRQLLLFGFDEASDGGTAMSHGDQGRGPSW
ncbi:hypothetical protein PIB30_013814 [Stylosanthes scabra]|uniref:GRF-type domain-containing protein n=1 Tax=Stylosanthes scabra TaxID=79078 RepID=A0ABU6S6W5_9FABA|nr:hypothetical protein [Stylosanthes scabra]